MNPYLLFAMGMSAYGSYSAGKAAKQAGEEEQRQLIENAKMEKLRALQEKNQRNRNFLDSMSAMDAQIGKDNRTDRSVATIRKRSRETLATEQGRARTQSLFQRGRIIRQGQIAALEGKQKQRAYMIEGAANFANSYSAMKDIS